MFRRYPPLLFCVPMLSCAPAMAADATGTGSGILQLGFGFIAILGLLFATLWLLKKLSLPRGGASSMVRVVSAAAVGPRERVVLVDVGGKRLVLGVAPGRVSLLDAQSAPEGLDEPIAASDRPLFAQRLMQTLAKRHGKP